jgi:hypothetical protein
MSKNNFHELNKLDVTKYIEKKGKFSYLSWAYAVRELKKQHPTSTWTVHDWDGIPFLKTECGYFVKVTVTVDGVDATQVHPVLDNRNQPLSSPNAFQINTSIQRCLAKAIALHGLGIHIYAGEDLPELENRGDQAIATSNASPEPQVAPLVSPSTLKQNTFEPYPDGKIDVKKVLNTMHLVGYAKGKKTYKECEQSLAKDIKYWETNAKSQDQKMHLENLRAVNSYKMLNNVGV